MRKYLIIPILFIFLISPLKVYARSFDDEIIHKSQLCVHDVCNKLEIIDGDYYLIENVGQITFDGSENWSIQNTNNPNVISVYISTLFMPNMFGVRDTLKVDKIFTVGPVGTGNVSNINTINYNSSGTYLIIDVSKDIADTLENWKQYLSQNPLTVVYQLATPTQIKINDTYLPDDNVYFPVLADFDIGNIFYVLYNGVISITLAVNTFWNWLTTQHFLNLSIPIIGEIWGFDFTPLGVLTGVGMIFVITLWLIKRLVPVA